MSETDDDLHEYKGCVRKDNQWKRRLKEERSGQVRLEGYKSP